MDITKTLTFTEPDFTYFPPHHTEDHLNPYYVQSLLDDTIRTVAVKFTKDGYEYTYLTRRNLKVGDLVLTKDSRSKYKIVEISSLHEVPQIERFEEIEYKWILQKIDQKKHSKFLKKENRAITNIKNDLLIHQRERDLTNL